MNLLPIPATAAALAAEAVAFQAPAEEEPAKPWYSK